MKSGGLFLHCSVLINQINAIAATNSMISSITKIVNNAFALFLSEANSGFHGFVFVDFYFIIMIVFITINYTRMMIEKIFVATFTCSDRSLS